MGEREKSGVIGCCCLLPLLISGVLVGCSFSVLEYNEVGIDFDATSQSINEEKLFQNGRHFIGLAHSFFVYPTHLLTVEFAEDHSSGKQLSIGQRLSTRGHEWALPKDPTHDTPYHTSR